MAASHVRISDFGNAPNSGEAETRQGLSLTIMCCAAATLRLRIRLGEVQSSASVLVDLGWREARWTMAGLSFQHQPLFTSPCAIVTHGKTLIKHKFELVC